MGACIRGVDIVAPYLYLHLRIEFVSFFRYSGGLLGGGVARSKLKVGLWGDFDLRKKMLFNRLSIVRRPSRHFRSSSAGIAPDSESWGGTRPGRGSTK